MVGQVPRTAPPAFGQQYADNAARARRLDGILVASDLDRRSALMRNIISNAPNIAATSGVGVVDQLANMFADSETPIFDNAYGQRMDEVRMKGATNRARDKSRDKGREKSGGSSRSRGPAVDPNRMSFVIPQGHPGAGNIVHFDNPEDVIRWGTIYGIPANQLNQYIRPPGFGGTHSIGQTGAGSGDEPGQQQVIVPDVPVGTVFEGFDDGITRRWDGSQWVEVTE